MVWRSNVRKSFSEIWMFCVPGEPSLALAEEGDDRPTAVCGADGWLVLGVYAAETLVLVVMVMRGWFPPPFLAFR